MDEPIVDGQTSSMKFAINRLDMSGAQAFAESAARAESLGWDMGLLPCSPLLVPDPYVCLALAAQKTSSLELGTLIDNPIVRHPSVLAGSICTVAELAPGRVHCGLGVGDSAVFRNGLQPATAKAFEEALALTGALIRGERVDVGAAKPASIGHARPVPLWVAAQGPKSLTAAGRHCDGVWIRVGTHPGNIKRAWESVCKGARDAGRDPDDIQIGLIFHTAYEEDADKAMLMAKAMAAGYYEFTMSLFDAPEFEWNGPDVHELSRKAYPDFHHHLDVAAAGQLVKFLDDEVGHAFALYGDWPQIAEQLKAALAVDVPVTYVVPHRVMAPDNRTDFMSSCAENLIPQFR